MDQATLNIEREIRPGMIVDVGYLDVRGLHNNHSTNINQAPPTAQGTDYNTIARFIPSIRSWGTSRSLNPSAGSWYDALTIRFAANIRKSPSINASYAHGRNFVNGNKQHQPPR